MALIPLPPSELTVTGAHIVAVGQKDARQEAKRARWQQCKLMSGTHPAQTILLNINTANIHINISSVLIISQQTNKEV